MESEALIHGTTCMNLRNVINERNNNKRPLVHISIYMKWPKQVNIQRQKVYMCLLRVRRWGGWRMTPNVYSILSWHDENFLKLYSGDDFITL